MCAGLNKSNYSLSNRTSSHVTILLIFSVLMFFANFGGWDLWGPDEPRYAQVAKEMMDSGNWILPHLNSQVYPDKPPVFFWLIALSSHALGKINSLSARLPSAIAAVLGVLITYLLGRKLYNSRAGFISALVLATSAEYFWLGHRANIDMALTLFILSALFFFYKGYQESCRWSYLLLYLFMGIAVLTKGPVGFILPTLIIIVYLISKREITVLKKVLPGWGSILFFTVILAWLIPSFMQGGREYLDEIIFNQILGRVHNSWSHKMPFYFYFVNLPSLMQPWFFLLPSVFIYFGARRKKMKGDYLFPLTWFTTIFLFFSMCSGKRQLYLLPLFPAFALMVGFLWNRFIEQDEDALVNRLVTIPFYLFSGLLLAACLSVPFIPESIGQEYRQTLHPYPLALFLGFSTVLTLFLFLKNKKFFSLILFITILAGAFFYAVCYVFPYLNQFESAKPFSLKIKDQMEAGDLLGSYCLRTSAFNFYTGLNNIRQLRSPGDLIDFFLQSNKQAYCIIARETLKDIVPVMPFPLFEWDGDTIGERAIVLISTRERS